MTTITLPRAVVEQALEALESLFNWKVDPERGKRCGDAVVALRAALAQKAEPAEPVQQPYCYVYEYDGVFGLHREFYPLPYNGMKPSRTVPVYTAPPKRVPLTEEEIESCRQQGYAHGGLHAPFDFGKAARAVERAHGIPKP